MENHELSIPARLKMSSRPAAARRRQALAPEAIVEAHNGT
jgi:hypothetical protein